MRQDIFGISIERPCRLQVVNRIAVRFINQIDIPLPMRDLGDYLRTVPEVSSDLPQALSRFFMQLTFPQPDFGGQLVLTVSMAAPPKPDVASVILDIDVFKSDAAVSSDDEAWSLLEMLRRKKNGVFEGCITDRARAMFDPVSE